MLSRVGMLTAQPNGSSRARETEDVSWRLLVWAVQASCVLLLVPFLQVRPVCPATNAGGTSDTDNVLCFQLLMEILVKWYFWCLLSAFSICSPYLRALPKNPTGDWLTSWRYHTQKDLSSLTFRQSNVLQISLILGWPFCHTNSPLTRLSVVQMHTGRP